MKTLVAIATILAAAAAAAVELDPGGAADAPSSWGIGARAEAVGRTYGALADDAASAYWNPAGLAAMSRTEVTLGYGRPFESIGDVNVGDAAVAKPLVFAADEATGGGSLGTLGAALAFRRAGGIYEAGPNGPTGRTFADTDVELYLAYAHTLGKKGGLGLTFKNVTRTVGDYQDSGFGLDVGTTFRPWAPLTLAGVVRNLVGPSYELKELQDVPPLALEFSGCYRLGGFAALVAGGNVTRETFVDGGGGVEVTPLKYVALRGGYWTGDARPRFGVGVAVGGIRFDYTMRVGGPLGDSHLASVSFLFGGVAAADKTPPPDDDGYIEYKPGDEGTSGEGGTPPEEKAPEEKTPEEAGGETPPGP